MFLLNETFWNMLLLWTCCSDATEKAGIGSCPEEHGWQVPPSLINPRPQGNDTSRI